MKRFDDEPEEFQETLRKVLKEYDQQDSLNELILTRDLTIELGRNHDAFGKIVDICKKISAIWDNKV